MLLFVILVIKFLIANADMIEVNGFCDMSSKTCTDKPQDFDDQKYLFYDVNSLEGFNLRRDVYMRFAIMLVEAQKRGKMKNWSLVLPPFHNLHHWLSSTYKSTPVPWGRFFDLNSLKSYAPVIEMYELCSKTPSTNLKIDTMYVLKNFEDFFENNDFRDKWKVTNSCYYDNSYWGFKNITVKERICISFQGHVSKIQDLLRLHSTDDKVMIAHGEIPLHDSYGTKEYWECRKSMKFNTELEAIAKGYIGKHLNCNNTERCSTYLSIHWRRRDFARYRENDVPSLAGTAKQIDEIVKKTLSNIKNIFIATDASVKEITELEAEFNKLGYVVHIYKPTEAIINKYQDGGIAIIDQIICAHATFFVGTHESTFSFRIQEEREILGFDSQTTFNRLCPDTGNCERPSKWTIVQ